MKIDPLSHDTELDAKFEPGLPRNPVVPVLAQDVAPIPQKPKYTLQSESQKQS